MYSISSRSFDISTELTDLSSMSSYSLPVSPAGSEFQVNDFATTTHLTSLLREQKYFIQAIDSLERTNNLNAKEAKVQSKHLEKFYDKFIRIQSKIAALVGDSSIGDHCDQVEILQKVQRKVRQIETKLEEIISSSETLQSTSVGPVINGHFNQTERSNVLDTHIKKQKSLIKQIELIESKKSLGTVEAEILYGHLSQLNDEFVKNQSKIETYVNGSAFDEQLRISNRILQKVIAVQIKLKGIIAAPVTSVSNGASYGDDEYPLFKPPTLDLVTSVHKCVSSHVETQEISFGSVMSSSQDVEVQGESLGSLSYFNKKVETFNYVSNDVYKMILQNIDYPPKVAGSIHLRPWVDNQYKQFLSNRKLYEGQVREFPYLLRRIKEISDRVERAVEDYVLYCDGRIPRRNLDYISSMI